MSIDLFVFLHRSVSAQNVQEIQIHRPNKRQTDGSNICYQIMAVFLIFKVLLAYLRWPVIYYRIEQQELVHLDKEAIEKPIARVVQRAPLDSVLLTELVQNENHGSDALPGYHGQELVQELIFDGLVEHREKDYHLKK